MGATRVAVAATEGTPAVAAPIQLAFSNLSLLLRIKLLGLGPKSQMLVGRQPIDLQRSVACGCAAVN